MGVFDVLTSPIKAAVSIVEGGLELASQAAELASLPGQLAEAACDAILPPELEFIGDIVQGLVDLETGNYAGLLDDATDLLADLGPQLAALAESAPAGVSPEVGPPGREGSALTPEQLGLRPADTPSNTRSSETTSTPPATASSDQSSGVAGDAKAFLAKSPAELMAAMRSGDIPDAVFDDPKAMQMLQAKMNQISQMMTLTSQLLSTFQQMQMSTIHNIRA